MRHFLLGVGREIITPAIGTALCGYEPDFLSEALNDDLTVTAFCFKSNGAVALMITATVVEIETALCDRLRAELSYEFSVPASHIVLASTHTHSGPNLMGQYGWGDIDTEYLETVFLPRLRAAVRTAIGNPRPVRMGVGVGESFVGINRREICKDGSIRLGQNPWGTFDPEMTVLSFTGEDGACVANIIHYGAHGTGAGKNVEITRDWSGVMTDRLEKISGGITAFFNGPEGDVGPRLTNGDTVGNLSLALELGGVAAQDAVRIYRTIHSYTVPDLALTCRDIAVPLEARIPPEQAHAGYEAYKEYTVNSLAARKAYFRRILDSYERGEADEPFFRFPQTLIRIGEIVFVSFPYELFSEIGLRIAHGTGGARVLSLSNANGAEGYFVTEDQLCRGGYEVDMFLHSRPQIYRPDSDTHLVLETLKNIDALNSIAQTEERA